LAIASDRALANSSSHLAKPLSWILNGNGVFHPLNLRPQLSSELFAIGAAFA
jgi:hypothetical protein